ncbi:MAG: hypothetical protein VB081_10470 [Christensenella sp.]|uniref:hypothetical protein n=1 Tax=Christensenella sp. TaxID=1935934 RepID=UPI002B1FE42C|nr:hypothetical protein [Christensenella sp.]MEA5003910.1 hypothetical protein [Christensenella sp.]
MLGLIIGLSIIMWYVIDRFKELWEGHSFGKFITVGVSAVLAFGLSFGFGLDLVFAMDLFEVSSTGGIILTALVLMSGSSAVSEIIGRIKGGEKAEG